MVAFNSRMHWKFGMILWGMLFLGGIYTNPLGAFLGSILPDSDHKRTLIGKIVPLWLVFDHRGATHTLWAMAVFGCISWAIFGLTFAKGFLIGYFSHLLMDATTPSGVRWFGRKKAPN